MSTSKTISLLRKVIQDPNCNRMNMSTIKGYLGELIVKKRLEDAGFEVEHQGNQSRHDLSFWVGDYEYKIDVKTSTIKDELSCGHLHWGWALKHSNKKNKITANHFICVGLDRNYKAQRFLVIPADYVAKFPHGIGQFNKVDHALCDFPKTFDLEKSDISKEKRDYIQKCQKWLRHKRIIRVTEGQSFKDIF
jgi:hypothetical protein